MDCAAIASGQVCPTTRYARMRDGRLERFCSILCPGSLASCRGIFVLSACATIWSRAKRSKSPPAFFAYRSQRKRGKEISGAPSAQRAEASGCGHEPDDFVPFCDRPARRASPFELRERAQKARFAPRYPLPSPAGETSFYPASAIKGAKLKCTPNIGRISMCLDGMSSVLYRAHVV